MRLLVLIASLAACSSSDTVQAPMPPFPAGTAISGTIGDLGQAQPTVSSFMIANSGETLIYLSSAALTCDQLTVSRWLGGTTAGTQVVELVFEGAPAPGTLDVPPAEVNYAPGGMSSAHEVSADAGSIFFETAVPENMVVGSFAAKYGGDVVTGTFHATFCQNGQGY